MSWLNWDSVSRLLPILGALLFALVIWQTHETKRPIERRRIMNPPEILLDAINTARENLHNAKTRSEQDKAVANLEEALDALKQWQKEARNG